MKVRIAIFASGSGSNAQKLMEYFKRSPDAEISLVLTNNSDAYVLQRADNFEIPSHIFDRNEFYNTDNVIDLLKNLDIDLIVLAGFLWLIPKNLIAEYPGRIINIHPAILPKFGGGNIVTPSLNSGCLLENSSLLPCVGFVESCVHFSY